MGLFLSKLVPVFLYPLGLAIVVLLVVLMLSFGSRRRLSRVLVLLVVVVLSVASSSVFARWLLHTLEAEYPPVDVAALPEADAIVILGGIVGQPLPPRVATDLTESSDRLFEAARLYKAGKARTVVVAGGNLPWQSAAKPEAILIRDLLAELGVPEDAIVVEADSRNTFENAANVAAIFKLRGWRTALLVTSGAHMPRAMAAFRCTPIEATPAAADILVAGPSYDSLLDILPDAEALAMTTSALKEYLGLAYYRWKGLAC